jgi:hypothetical protein
MHAELQQLSLVGRVRQYVEKYERRASTIALIFAFIIDSVTLVRVDFWLTQALIIGYLVIGGVSIFFLNFEEDQKPGRLTPEGKAWLLILIQFAFGGLFGRYLIYYSRSGEVLTSWPFLLLLFALVVGNEFAKKYYARIVFHIGMFYTALLFFLIFYIPVVIGRMGTVVFLFSGMVSLVGVFFILWVAAKFIPKSIETNRFAINGTIVGILVFTNILYFTHIIPPLPLGLHDVGVYYAIEKKGNEYEVSSALESNNWFKKLLPLRPTMYITDNAPVYVYSAVFAPVNFGTNIAHRWEFYSTTTKQWVNRGKITFPIVGGEDRGYRGYSIKSSVEPGLWRVTIETENGLVIGRKSFKVEQVSEMPILITDTK